jgi:spermidine synthase
MQFTLKHALLFVVFVTGASVLVVEIVATRILSPYFGNTIYTYSSVIGVVLTALSLGYYIGGRLADRKPSLLWFFSIILGSGFSIFVLEFLILAILPIFGYTLSIIYGPVVSATVLFLIPSLLLGMLSPFAIKLVEKYSPKEGVGTISGLVFFWSTLGSILGSFLAGFFLIPRFGITQIILTIGILLTCIGAVGLYFSNVKKKRLIKITVIIVITASSLFLASQYNGSHGLVYESDGVYEKISIFDHQFEGRPTRFLNQDRSFSGAMFFGSDELVYDYTKYFALHEVFNSAVNDVLVIGGGAYSIPKAFFQALPSAQIDVVEIEPSLFSLAEEYFNVPDDSRLKNYIEDGRRFLYDTNKKYDVIFSDVYYSLYSIPAHFTTKEFFQLVRDQLNENGIFIANLIGSLSRQYPSLLFAELRTFETVFPNFYLFAVDSPKSFNSQNNILVGYKSDRIPNFKEKNILENKNSVISSLSEKFVDLKRFNLSQYPIFTDNYAPVEYYTAFFLQREVTEKYNGFNGQEALALVKQKMSYGPRFLRAKGHELVQEFITSELNTFADKLVVQKWRHYSSDGSEIELMNIAGQFFPNKKSRILIGTHYDSKQFADQDQKSPQLPVPGANDSASGTAVLLEIARLLSSREMQPSFGVDLVFFDAEEGEDLSKSSWSPLGSSYFVEHINEFYPGEVPEQVIIVDMVCDKNLTIYKEQSSVEKALKYVNDFWNIASKKYPNIFIPEVKHSILDDHTPFHKINIPSFLIIDFDYEFFHTTEDTLDKCTAKSLEAVGNVLFDYIYSI